MAVVPFVHSGYERIKDDNYQTIDPRCVAGLLATWEIEGLIVDCCSPNGSGIVNELIKNGKNAKGQIDAFDKFDCDWIVSNPPYARGIVDDIVRHQINRVKSGKVDGFASLMRANWDFAASRADMFNPAWYAGQTRMRFRPWWSEERDAQPIHNFVWHVWMESEYEPVVRYWTPKKGNQ